MNNMKKRLLSLGLIFALVFSFAACTSEPPKTNQGETPPQAESPSTSEQPDDNQGETPPQEGLENTPGFYFYSAELLYWEISDSVDADTKLQERVFSMTELQNSIEYQRSSAPFENFDGDFFEEKSLLIYRFKTHCSGGTPYLIDTYSFGNEKDLRIRVVYMCGDDPQSGNGLMLIELGRDDYTRIYVNIISEEDDFEDDDVIFGLTEKATAETIFHDYTVEDFPEVNAVSIGEITIYTSEEIRQCLLKDPTGATIPDNLKNYTRSFVLNLAEKGKRNVLRAIVILSERDDIEYAQPNYIYHLD